MLEKSWSLLQDFCIATDSATTNIFPNDPDKNVNLRGFRVNQMALWGFSNGTREPETSKEVDRVPVQTLGNVETNKNNKLIVFATQTNFRLVRKCKNIHPL